MTTARESTDRSLHGRTCPACEATRWPEVTVEDETVVRIRGDRDEITDDITRPAVSLPHGWSHDETRNSRCA